MSRLVQAVLLILVLFSLAYTQGIKSTGRATSINAADISGQVDISSQTNLSVASSGLVSLVGDEIQSNDLFIESEFFTNPVTGHSNVWQPKFPYNFTITRISCATDVATSTADIEFEERGEATADTAGTEVMGADLQCDTNGASFAAGFANATIAANDLLSMKITAVANAPEKLRVYVTGRYTP